MNVPPSSSLLVLCLLVAGAAAFGTARAQDKAVDPAFQQAAAEARKALRARHGEGEGARIDRGVAQCLSLWRAEDGDPAALRRFVEDEFLPAGPVLDGTFERFEFTLERTGGYLTSLVRDLRRAQDLEIGPLLPIDQRLAGWSPGAHVAEDLFGNKAAFVALLNFPLTTLPERIRDGMSWSRRQWAEARLAQQFATRVPAEVNEKVSQAYAEAETYVNGLNVFMHHVLARDGRRPFPAGLRLISHWNLRDELKAQYGAAGGLEKQRLIQKVMERIVTQEIPLAVINNPLLDWTPETGAVAPSPVKDAEPPPGARAEASAAREPDTRYRIWADVFRAERLADPYHPQNPTFVDRRFNASREIPEDEVKALFEALLTSPLGERVGRVISVRLGRPLEAFDVWYPGFKPGSTDSEAELDKLTRKRYPTAEAYAADIPRLLRDLGFSEEKARFLAAHIVVEPSRGAGHAFGPARRDDKAHLRTRVHKDGMDYKGYNIAVHEMGHNVEQVFSTISVDHSLLQGVPNNAFTEALAFVFQHRDLELLGRPAPGADAESAAALDAFWNAREIAGVGLLDIAAWRWLYAHPEATPAQFREAVVGLARDIWNRYYAPVLGTRDTPLLGIYSHLVSYGLYIPDYPLGHLIAFQVEDHFRGKPGPMGGEFERIARLGNLTPDAWMRKAVGAPLSAQPLLAAAEAALARGDRPAAN
jgi:hypothetical protein